MGTLMLKPKPDNNFIKKILLMLIKELKLLIFYLLLISLLYKILIIKNNYLQNYLIYVKKKNMGLNQNF